jgi:internalin A
MADYLKQGSWNQGVFSMKKLQIILLTVLLTIRFVFTDASAAKIAQSFEVSSDSKFVKFVDPVLEAMVRGSMGKLEGDITMAEAEALTRLNLSNSWQQYIYSGHVIRDISGLEYFTNLESLDLSDHAITDISPLKELPKLTLLSLGGNPVDDLTPLTGLTSLKVLILSNCAAQDYNPLVKLIHLEILKLDNSTITDVSLLTSLKNLKQLYLANSPVNDYSLLENIYPNLEKKDFTLASTLKELGFTMDNNNHQAFYDGEHASITINHTKWGAPPAEWDANIIRTSTYLVDDYKLLAGFYGDLNAYVFQIVKNDKMLVNYVYDKAHDSFTIGEDDRESTEKILLAVMDVMDGEDVLLAPMRIFNDIIQKTFNRTAKALYAMPYEPPTLKNLGFFPDLANAVYLYEQREGRDVNIEIHHSEWGEKDYDFRFFTELSDEYRIVLMYDAEEKKIVVGADDNNQGGAKFTYFIETQEHIDDWCSNKDMTVEEYFIKAYNDSGIENIYQHSVDLMLQYVQNTFGMTLEALYALPTGD